MIIAIATPHMLFERRVRRGIYADRERQGKMLRASREAERSLVVMYISNFRRNHPLTAFLDDCGRSDVLCNNGLLCIVQRYIH